MTVGEREMLRTIGSITSALVVPHTTPDFSNSSNIPYFSVVNEQVFFFFETQMSKSKHFSFVLKAFDFV